MSGSNAIQIMIQFMADYKSAVTGSKKVEDQLEEVGKAAAKAEQKLNRLTDANQGLARSQTQLHKSASMLSMAWKQGSTVVDKRYLSSITGLREGLYRFNRESEKTIVTSGKMGKTLADGEFAFQRFMMKGNLVTRTLDNMGQKMQNVGKNMQWTGRQMMVGVTAPILGIGAVAVKSAMDIDKLDIALEKVMNTASESQFAELDQQTKDLATTFGIARTELKGVQTEFARVGFGVEKVKKATEQTTELSMVGDVELADAQQLVQVLYQTGMAYEEVQEQLEKFNVIDDQTNLSLKETVASLKDVYPTARQFGVSASEIAALMTGITQGGFSSSEAAKSLNNALVKIPTALANMQNGASGGAARLRDLQDQLKQVNKMTGMDLSLFEDDGKTLRKGSDLIIGFSAAIDSLQRSGDPDKMAAAMQALRAAFATEGMPEGRQLVESIAKSFTDPSQDLAKAMGIAQSKSAQIAAQWVEQLDIVKGSEAVQLQGQIQQLIISGQELGKKLIPIAVKVFEWINKIVDKIMKLPEGTQKFLIALAAGLALLGPIVFAFGQVGIVLGTLFRGAIGPAKQFFKLVGTNQDAITGAQKIKTAFTEALDTFADTGDLDEFKRKTTELFEENAAGAKKAALEAAGARELETEAIEEQTRELNENTAARARNAQSSGLTEILPDVTDDTADYNARGDQRAQADIDDLIARRRKEAEPHIDEAFERLKDRDTVRTESYTPGANKPADKEARATIADLTARLEDWDDDLAEEAAEAFAQFDGQPAELTKFTKQLDAMKETRMALEGFEKAYGIPVPISPNFDIPTLAERNADFAKRLGMFFDSFEAQLPAGALKDIDGFMKEMLDEDPVTLRDMLKNAMDDSNSGRIGDYGPGGTAFGVQPKKKTKNRELNAVIEHLGMLAGQQVDETGMPQILTDTKVKDLLEAVAQGPTIPQDMAYEAELQEKIRKALAGDGDQGASVDKIVDDIKDKLGTEVKKEKLARPDQRKNKSLAKDLFNSWFDQDSKSLELIEGLDQLADEGDEAAREAAAKLTAKRNASGDAVQRIQDAVKQGLAPDKADLVTVQDLRGDVERAAFEIAEQFDLRYAGAASLPELDEMIAHEVISKQQRAGAPVGGKTKRAVSGRRKSALETALKNSALNRQKLMDEGGTWIDEIFGVDAIPEFDESSVEIRHLTGDDLKKSNGRFMDASEEYAFRKKHAETAVEDAKKIFDEKRKAELKGWLDGARGSGSVKGFAEQNGIPEELKEALTAAVFGGAEESGAGGYAEMVRKHFGDMSDEALEALNELGAEIAASSPSGTKRDMRTFQKRAAAARRRQLSLPTSDIDAKDLEAPALMAGGSEADRKKAISEFIRRSEIEYEKQGEEIAKAQADLDDVQKRRRGKGNAQRALKRTTDSREALAQTLGFKNGDEMSKHLAGRGKILDSMKAEFRDLGDTTKERGFVDDVIARAKNGEKITNVEMKKLEDVLGKKVSGRGTNAAKVARLEDYADGLFGHIDQLSDKIEAEEAYLSSPEVKRFNGLTKEQSNRQARLAEIADDYEGYVDETNRREKDAQQRLEKAKRKQGTHRMAMERANKTFREGPVGEGDLDVIKKALTRERDPLTGQLRGGKGLDVSKMVGGLSPEMAAAVHEMTVIQTRDLDEAKMVIQRYMPEIDPDDLDDFAKAGRDAAMALDRQLDEAAVIFGEEFMEQRQRAAERRGKARSGLDPALATTQSSHTDGGTGRTGLTDFQADLFDADNQGANAKSIKGSSDVRENRQQDALNDILSGLVDDDIEAEKRKIHTTQKNLDRLDKEIEAGEAERNKMMSKFRRGQRKKKDEYLSRARREVEKLKDERAEAEARLASLQDFHYYITDPSGDTKKYSGDKGMEQYEQRKRREAEEMILGADDMRDGAVDGGMPEFGITDDERDEIIKKYDDADRRERDVENRRRQMMRDRAERYAREDNDAARGSGKRKRTLRNPIRGALQDAADVVDADALAEMHLMDLIDGSGRKKYTGPEVDLYIANRVEAALDLADDVDDAVEDALDKRKPAKYWAQEGFEDLPDAPGKKRSGTKNAAGEIIDLVDGGEGGNSKKKKGSLLNPLSWMDMLNPMSKVDDAAKGVAGSMDEVGASAAKSGGMLSAIFPSSGGLVTSLSGLGPVLLILAAIAAVVVGLIVTFKKWGEYAEQGLARLKEAFGNLIDSVVQPFKDMWGSLTGANEEGTDGMGSMWENLGGIMQKFFDGLAQVIEFITPIIKGIATTIAGVLYVIVQIFRAVFALLNGDMTDFKDAFANIWDVLFALVTRGLAAFCQGVITLIQELAKGMIGIFSGVIDSFGGLFSSLPDWVPGANELGEWISNADDSLKGFVDEAGNAAKDKFDRWFEGDIFPGGAFKDAGNDAGDETQEGLDESGPLDLPAVDDSALQDSARDAVSKFISAFQSQMRKIVDGWKEAAMKAFDDWAKAQVEAVEKRIEAIDKEMKAERERDQDLEYLQRKEELRQRRRSESLNHSADRDLAIYEGRYDDAKQLDYEYGKTLEELAREEAELEKDRQQTLTDRLREAAKERLNIEKEELQKSLDMRREQLQAQLDAMTEYIPRNVAEAQRMHQAIQGKMLEFTNGYGVIGAGQAANWGKGWSDAFAAARTQVAHEAYWAGEAAMKEFAAALGIDASLITAGSGPGASGTGGGTPARAVTQEEALHRFRTGEQTWHTGGPIGNTSMAPSDVPATLQTGEYVVQRKAVSKLGRKTMDKINRGEYTYHTGGMVGEMPEKATGAAKNAMGQAFGRGVTAWKDGRTSMRVGATVFSAQDYRDSLQAAYNEAMGMYSGGGGELGTGPLAGVDPRLVKAFNAYNHALGGILSVTSGYRDIKEQTRLWYAKGQNPRLVAPPGTSNHEYGLAIDHAPNSTPGMREIAKQFNLVYRMSWEPWHVEVNGLNRNTVGRGPGPAIGGEDGGVRPDKPGGLLRLRDDLIKPPVNTSGGPFVADSVGTQDLKNYVKGKMASYGWGPDQWPALERIVYKESGWNPAAKNPTSTAAGLFQFLDMTWKHYITNRGGPPYWSTDPGVQVPAGLSYIKERYGTPDKALAFHLKNNWYHKGGMVFPAMAVGGQVLQEGVAKVHAGETVLTRKLTDQLTNQDFAGDVIDIDINLNGFLGSQRELEQLHSMIETKVVPKIQRARGKELRKISKVTK